MPCLVCSEHPELTAYLKLKASHPRWNRHPTPKKALYLLMPDDMGCTVTCASLPENMYILFTEVTDSQYLTINLFDFGCLSFLPFLFRMFNIEHMALSKDYYPQMESHSHDV